ncbi:MAG: hypothetical protein BWY87_01529 [Deltaproteobacteria bacterium ADurb.Bin510]|nr:MAG: hypothetical protein BWY87_01529 [Deltaproteobacteria bacterium ADurb.Bin510]
MLAQVGSGIKRKIAVDDVVLAVGARANDSLYWELNRIGRPRVVMVGDALGIGRIADATRSACQAALALR